MARKRKFETKENHERWLVSYADFVTLLFAFFVVMFANSQVDREKMQSVSESVKGALESGSISFPIHGFLGRSRDVRPNERGMANAPGSFHRQAVAVSSESRLVEFLPSVAQLNKELEAEIKEGKIQVDLTPRGLVVSIRAAALFAPGGDTIDAAAFEMLDKLADTMKKLPNPVRMEGHTDATPISTARFRSNWELSAARAISMMEIMTGRFGVPRDRVAIAGYAETAPVDANDNAEGRARNRRVDIVILNQLGQVSEPKSAPKPVAQH